MTISNKKILWLAVAVGVTLAVTAATFVSERSFASSDATKLVFLDVGQGDGMLIRDAGGQDVLIDAGPDGAVLEGLARQMPWWDRTLDTVIITHLDTDHYVGLFGILGKYEIGEFWWNGAMPTTDTARRLIAEVERRGIPQRVVHVGDRLEFQRGRSLEVLYPFDDVSGRIPPKAKKDAVGGTNDWGIVTRFTCGADVVLLTADISSAVEKALVERVDVRAMLLKTAHHGSANSSSEIFLDAVDPDAAVISSGAGNRYGHPTSRVLRALLERGIDVHRTDREGDIAYVCDAGGLHPEDSSSILPASI